MVKSWYGRQPGVQYCTAEKRSDWTLLCRHEASQRLMIQEMFRSIEGSPHLVNGEKPWKSAKPFFVRKWLVYSPIYELLAPRPGMRQHWCLRSPGSPCSRRCKCATKVRDRSSGSVQSNYFIGIDGRFSWIAWLGIFQCQYLEDRAIQQCAIVWF